MRSKIVPPIEPVDAVAALVCQDKGYQLDNQQIVAGAFKRTYRAVAGSDILAVKIIAGHVDAERARREISALERCDHPNIVRLLGTGLVQYNGREWVFFIEEFLAGGTLTAALESQGPLDLARGRLLAAAISSAIDHLANRQIVHRDIKPDNIMYRSADHPVLVDLGIARHLEATALTADGLLGPHTPGYAAPEQLLAERDYIDWRCDQYSLGVVLSIAMFGVHPATGAPIDGSTRDFVARRQPPAAEFLRQASGFAQLVRMVQPWPAQRFARPHELVAAWGG